MHLIQDQGPEAAEDRDRTEGPKLVLDPEQEIVDLDRIQDQGRNRVRIHDQNPDPDQVQVPTPEVIHVLEADHDQEEKVDPETEIENIQDQERAQNLDHGIDPNLSPIPEEKADPNLDREVGQSQDQD